MLSGAAQNQPGISFSICAFVETIHGMSKRSIASDGL
jgi:hypothetical protein